jgi:ABC-2 type transport system permease protein
VVLAAGAAAAAASVVAGRYILPGNGFTAAHGSEPLLLSAGPTLRAAGGSVLYLALIGLLSLGLATALRDSGASIAVALGLLYIVPLLTDLGTLDPVWQHRLQEWGPMTAGLSVQATRNLKALPIGPWPGLGVLAGWAAAALLAGGLVLRLRDA